MELTNAQQEGLKIAVERYRNHEKYTVIAGFAGTGKSTLVKFIINALQLPPEKVAYITYTGKAALVLRQKGCPNAMTAHKLLYHSSLMPNGSYFYRPRKELEGDYELLVIDEISMLPKDLWELALSHKIHILALGDPFQLPPISKSTDNHVLDFPHIFLDEIVRQAENSEIIKLSMDIRNNNPINYFDGKEVKIIRKSDLVSGMLTWADQILVATNKTKDEINKTVRNILNKNGILDKEEKIICLNNEWGILDTKFENALVNGTIGYLLDYKESNLKYKPYPSKEVKVIVPKYFVTEDENIFSNFPIDFNYFDTKQYCYLPEEKYNISKKKGNPILPIPFDYGYAITCHKAQGSQWDRVLIFEERFPFNKEEHARWLYTAITRASKKIILVR